ncbi:MAG: GNAT family N-acetyltransferase, partial [Geminicoccaceae bacterium]
MSSQQAVYPTWSEPSHASNAGSRATFPLILKFGPYRLAQANFDLTIIDLGQTAISGEDVDAQSLPFDRALYLKSVPERLALASSSIAESMLVYPFYRYDRSWVVTEGSFDNYLSSFSKTSRKGLKRRTKKLAELSGGHLDIRRFDRADLIKPFYTHARAVSANTFQEKLMDDGLPADDAFFDDMIRMVLGGQCYGSILFIEEQPISYLYCERRGSGWLPLYGGFDPAYAGLSPGTVHLLSVLEHSFNDQSTAFFDFGPGKS